MARNPRTCVSIAAKLARRSDKHFAKWNTPGHYWGFADAKSKRANRNRAQAILLAEMLKGAA